MNDYVYLKYWIRIYNVKVIEFRMFERSEYIVIFVCELIFV